MQVLQHDLEPATVQQPRNHCRAAQKMPGEEPRVGEEGIYLLGVAPGTLRTGDAPRSASKGKLKLLSMFHLSG